MKTETTSNGLQYTVAKSYYGVTSTFHWPYFKICIEMHKKWIDIGNLKGAKYMTREMPKEREE